MAEQAKTMPIAITGMACRFPGQADTPEALWEVIASARNTWSEWPKDRLNEKAFSHPQAEHLGTVSLNTSASSSARPERLLPSRVLGGIGLASDSVS